MHSPEGFWLDRNRNERSALARPDRVVLVSARDTFAGHFSHPLLTSIEVVLRSNPFPRGIHSGVGMVLRPKSWEVRFLDDHLSFPAQISFLIERKEKGNCSWWMGSRQEAPHQLRRRGRFDTKNPPFALR